MKYYHITYDKYGCQHSEIADDIGKPLRLLNDSEVSGVTITQISKEVHESYKKAFAGVIEFSEGGMTMDELMGHIHATLTPPTPELVDLVYTKVLRVLLDLLRSASKNEMVPPVDFDTSWGNVFNPSDDLFKKDYMAWNGDTAETFSGYTVSGLSQFFMDSLGKITWRKSESRFKTSL